jgi:hypothetical protein
MIWKNLRWHLSGQNTWRTLNHKIKNYGFKQIWRSYGPIAGEECACFSVELFFAPTSPQTVGTLINLTAIPCCSVGATPEYRFLLRRPDTVWYDMSGGWQTGATLPWTTDAEVPGNYRWQVWIRDTSSDEIYQGYVDAYFELLAP